MTEFTLSSIARALDAMLDAQMTAQASVAAQLVAAGEAGNLDPERINQSLRSITSSTALDEVWITDEKGVAYLTSLQDEEGNAVPFHFEPDPEAQPQASPFYRLLSSPTHHDDVVTQRAQVRELDQEVYKYVGVNGVDRSRIVQVGNAVEFTEHGGPTGGYTSPVLTAVLASIGEPELLSSASTHELGGVGTAFEEILGHQMAVIATITDRFVELAEAANWDSDEINGRFRRVVHATSVLDLRTLDPDGNLHYTATPPESLRGNALGREDLDQLLQGSRKIVDRISESREEDGPTERRVAVSNASSSRIVQVVQPANWPMIMD